MTDPTGANRMEMIETAGMSSGDVLHHHHLPNTNISDTSPLLPAASTSTTADAMTDPTGANRMEMIEKAGMNSGDVQRLVLDMVQTMSKGNDQLRLALLDDLVGGLAAAGFSIPFPLTPSLSTSPGYVPSAAAGCWKNEETDAGVRRKAPRLLWPSSDGKCAWMFFTKLPQETQDMIWDMALETSNIMTVGPDWTGSRIRIREEIPAPMHVCKASRERALKKYGFRQLSPIVRRYGLIQPFAVIDKVLKTTWSVNINHYEMGRLIKKYPAYFGDHTPVSKTERASCIEGFMNENPHLSDMWNGIAVAEKHIRRDVSPPAFFSGSTILYLTEEYIASHARVWGDSCPIPPPVQWKHLAVNLDGKIRNEKLLANDTPYLVKLIGWFAGMVTNIDRHVHNLRPYNNPSLPDHKEDQEPRNLQSLTIVSPERCEVTIVTRLDRPAGEYSRGPGWAGWEFSLDKSSTLFKKELGESWGNVTWRIKIWAEEEGDKDKSFHDLLKLWHPDHAAWEAAKMTIAQAWPGVGDCWLRAHPLFGSARGKNMDFGNVGLFAG